MGDLFPTTIEEQIAEVERELTMRRRVYANWIERGKMKPETADVQIRRMQAVLETLRWVEEQT